MWLRREGSLEKRKHENIEDRCLKIEKCDLFGREMQKNGKFSYFRNHTSFSKHPVDTKYLIYL